MKKILLMTLMLCSTGIADDTPDHAKKTTPLDVLADCVDAVKQRDFRRYVDHLSPEEQKLQAGLILMVQSSGMMAESIGAGNDTPPGDRLLFYVLNDLRKKHSVPKSKTEADKNTDSLTGAAVQGQMINSAIQQLSAEHFQLEAQFQASGRHLFIQSAKTLKDPAEFLVEALEEVFRSTKVSGKPPKASADTLSMTDVIKDLCEPYEKLEFTLYTRGDYAIAVADIPRPATESTEPQVAATPQPPLALQTLPPAQAELAPPTASPAQFTAPYPAQPTAAPIRATELQQVPGTATDTESRVTVFFRCIGDQWKISELLPLQQVYGNL